MSVYSIVKFSIGTFVVIGSIFMAIGIGKLWLAYDFYRHSNQVPGIFRGYHTVERTEKYRDSNGYTSYRTVSEDFPMFVYQDENGKQHHVTAEESHVFRYLSYDDNIHVLIRIDSDETPRIDGFMSLYLSPLISMAISGLFIFLPLKALKFANSWLNNNQENPAHAHLQSRILEQTNDTIKFSDVFIYLFILFGLFAVIAGALWYFTAPENSPTASPPSSALPSSDYRQAPPSTAKLAAKPVYEQQGSTELYQAARRGDSEAVRRLLATGEHIYDIRPAVVQTLIRKNDKATLELIFADGFDLTQHYARQTFGDQAVAEGRSEIVRLIKRYQGVFEAPPVYVALAAEDLDTLKNLIREINPKTRFRGMTPERYAKRYHKEELLQQALE